MEIIVAILALAMGAFPAQWWYMGAFGSKKSKKVVGIATWLAFSALFFLAAIGK